VGPDLVPAQYAPAPTAVHATADRSSKQSQVFKWVAQFPPIQGRQRPGEAEAQLLAGSS